MAKKRALVCHRKSATRSVRGSRTKKGRPCYVSPVRRSAGKRASRSRRLSSCVTSYGCLIPRRRRLSCSPLLRRLRSRRC